MTYNIDWSKVEDRGTAVWHDADPNTGGFFEFTRYIDRDGERVFQVMNAITNSICTTMMVIGMNEVNERNIDEFYTRCMMYYNACGDPLRRRTPVGVDEDRFEMHDYRWTYTDLVAHLGLHTNASILTMAAFKRHLMDIVESPAKQQMFKDRDAYQRGLIDADKRVAVDG